MSDNTLSARVEFEISNLRKFLIKLIFSDVWKDIFFPTLICALIAHFPILANSYFNHDSVVVSYNNLDWTLPQGKWFATPLNSLDGVFSISYLSLIIGFFFLFLCAGIYCIEFNICNHSFRKIVGVALVSFTSVVAIALYHGTDYFSFSLFLAVVGASFVLEKGITCFTIGTILMCLSVGAYQPYIGASLAFFATDLVLSLIKKQKFFMKAFKYGCSSVIALCLYYIILKIKLIRSGGALSAYKGMNSMSENLKPAVLIKSAIQAFKDFYSYFFIGKLRVESSKLIFFIAVFWCMIVCGMLVYATRKYAYKMFSVILIFAGIYIVIPLCFNFVGILSQNSSFYQHSILPFAFFPLLIIALYENLVSPNGRAHNNGNKLSNISGFAIAVIVVLMEMSWIREDAIVYQIVENYNVQCDAKIPEMATAIQSVGTSEQFVVFVGDTPYDFLKTKGLFGAMSQTYNTSGYAFSENEIYSDGVLLCVLNNRYGYDFMGGDKEKILLDYGYEILDMPVYPQEGSIILRDNTIVVKLGEIDANI